MAGFKCPFCGTGAPDIHETHQTSYARFHFGGRYEQEWGWAVHMLRCPECEKISTIAHGCGTKTDGQVVQVFPESSAIQFPEYVPEGIRRDYEEAYSILNKSPKASATLARRCLQGMIRDFFGVTDKPNLYQEIDAIKDRVMPAQWAAIDAVRKIGNIGAHMEKDVDLIIDVEQEEAEQLLRLIELLMDKWYVARHDEEELYKAIVETGKEKAAAKCPE